MDIFNTQQWWDPIDHILCHIFSLHVDGPFRTTSLSCIDQFNIQFYKLGGHITWTWVQNSSHCMLYHYKQILLPSHCMLYHYKKILLPSHCMLYHYKQIPQRYFIQSLSEHNQVNTDLKRVEIRGIMVELRSECKSKYN